MLSSTMSSIESCHTRPVAKLPLFKGLTLLLPTSHATSAYDCCCEAHETTRIMGCRQRVLVSPAVVVVEMKAVQSRWSVSRAK